MSTGARFPARRLAAAAAALAAGLGGVAAGAAPRELAVCSDPANLPYSNERQEGFENRIATLLAREMNASLSYTWNVQRRSFLRRTLQARRCDVVIGLPAGLQGVVQTRPYYASSYAFVTLRERGLQIAGFDDPALRGLRIGLQAVGAEGANPPPASSLARRGLSAQVVGFPVWGGGEPGDASHEGEDDGDAPQARIVDAVARGEIDVAVVWGPTAGYFAGRHGGRLAVTPVAADPALPGLAFRYEMAIGVRRGDEALRDELQQVLDRRAPEIQAILQSYGVPLVAGQTQRSTGE